MKDLHPHYGSTVVEEDEGSSASSESDSKTLLPLRTESSNPATDPETTITESSDDDVDSEKTGNKADLMGTDTGGMQAEEPFPPL